MTKLERLKHHPFVESVYDERDLDNGIWCYLKPGYIWQCDTHQVHEDTVAECLEHLRLCVEPCNCAECVSDSIY